MEFLKSSEIVTNKAGYLVSSVSNKPVTHEKFVAQQTKAHYVVSLAAAVKGKTFKSTKVDNLESIKAEVMKSINSAATRNYVDQPEKPVSKVNNELVKFALDFANYETAKEETSKINELMQEFNCIADVEEFGEYFTEGLVKLNKIYTISEIKEAVLAYNKATQN